MRFSFLRYLPEVTLANIDEVIREEVVPHVKNINVLSERIREQALTVAHSEGSSIFFGNLAGAWKFHNDLAIEIDTFLCALWTGELSLSSSTTLKRCADFLEKAFRAEDTKRIYSAGVKPALARFSEEVLGKYSFSPEDTSVIFTPWVPAFWVLYWGEHVLYLHAMRTCSETELIKQRLCGLFHASEETIFSSRLRRDFLRLSEYTAPELLKEVEQYQEACARVNDLRVRGIYLTLERPDLKSIQAIVRYDNYEEHLFGCNLYGLPDLFLRKWTVEFLVSKKLLDSRPSVLLYQKDELISIMDDMTSKKHKSYPAAVSSAGPNKKEPQMYLQTRSTTCGVACMMMAMNYFLGTPLSSKEEGKLRHRLKIRGCDIVPAISLARHMATQGLSVEIVHQDSEKFWEVMRYSDERILEGQREAYERALHRGIRPQQRPVTLKGIKEHLEKGRLVIYGILLQGGVKHALLVYGYDSVFYAIDPLRGKVTYTEEELFRAGELDTGRWFIAVWHPDVGYAIK